MLLHDEFIGVCCSSVWIIKAQLAVSICVVLLLSDWSVLDRKVITCEKNASQGKCISDR